MIHFSLVATYFNPCATGDDLYNRKTHKDSLGIERRIHYATTIKDLYGIELIFHGLIDKNNEHITKALLIGVDLAYINVY